MFIVRLINQGATVYVTNINTQTLSFPSYLPLPLHLQHPELLLVSYYTNPNIPHDPDGVALMWDLKFKKDTPDYIFNCQVRDTVPEYIGACLQSHFR